MRNHYHLVLETSGANLVSGMAWLQTSYTIRLERPRSEEVDQDALQEFRQGWAIGSEPFQRECLERTEGKLGENPPGQIRLETAEVRADRIVAGEPGRLQRTQSDLRARPKSDPSKLALAARLRRETTLSVKQIAGRLHLGKPKGATANLHTFMNPPETNGPQIQLEI